MRDKLITLLKIVVSFGLIALALWLAKPARVLAQLASANLWLVLGALALFTLAIIVNGAKWQILLRAQGVRAPFRAVLQFLYVGFFFNNFLPANVGGDVMRGYGLARYTDRIAEAAVSVVVDRIVGLLAYLATAAVAAVVAVNISGQDALQQVEWVAVLALAILASTFAVLLSRRLRSVIARLFAWRLLAPLAPLWLRVSDALNAYRFKYRALAAAFAVGLAGIVCTTFVNWCLSQAMGGLMSLPAIFLFNPLIALVLMIPVSIGGLGVGQAVYPALYGLAGVPAEHSIAVSVLVYAISIVASLPGGLLWWQGRRRPAG